MNCQEPPEPECRCCDKCIQLQNERFRRNNYQQSCQAPPFSQHRRNESYCEDPVYAIRSEKRSSGRQKFSPHRENDCDQKQWVDPSTLKTLSSLRERACKFLETSEGTRTPDEDECRPYTRVKESYPYDTPVRKQAQNINYEPESNFLRKMKRKNDMMSEADIYPPTPCECAGYTHDRAYVPEPQYSSCMRSANDYTAQTVRPSRQYVSERATQCSDASSIPDPCTCYKTWRPKSPEDECVDDAYLMKEYNELCRELSEFQETLETGNDACDYDEDEEVDIARGESGKCQHVSRCDTQAKRKSKRGSATNGKPCQASENDFEPSLKKPHPNSCDRCWRYASPSRSPVNKPSQRFDPNYRKSHSDIYLNADGKGKETQGLGSRGSKTNSSCDERETKVHQLMTPVGHSAGGSVPPALATKSSDEMKKGRGSKSFAASQLGDRTASKSGKEGSGGRGGGGARESAAASGGWKSQSKTDDPNMKSSQSRGDGRSLSVNFEDKSRKKADPIQSSPSMFDKNSQKTGKKPGGGGRPSTSETNGSATKLKKGSKSKTAIGSQASTCNVKSGKTRTQSFDREVRSPCSKERTGGPSTSMKQPTSKPPSVSETQHRSDCPYKQKAAYDPSRGGFQRPDTAGSSSCMCKNTGSQQGSSRRGSSGCPRHGSDGSPRREITSSAHRCGNCQFCRRNSPSSPSRSSRDGPGIRPSGSVNATAEGKKCGCRNHRPSSVKPTENRSGSAERQNNPRKYCVFYMNKTKLNRAHDIEVLIEELTQGKSSKASDSGDEAIREKMKKIKEVRGDSMALRFQKGVTEGSQRPENKVLYF